jgi:hypothetical protein
VRIFVARDGLEPPQTEPKSVVLPLDDRAKMDGKNNYLILFSKGKVKKVIFSYLWHLWLLYVNKVINAFTFKYFDIFTAL